MMECVCVRATVYMQLFEERPVWSRGGIQSRIKLQSVVVRRYVHLHHKFIGQYSMYNYRFLVPLKTPL